MRNHTQYVLWLTYTYIHRHTHTSDYTPTLIDMHTYTYILYTDMHTDTHTDTVIHTHAYTHSYPIKAPPIHDIENRKIN